MAPRIAIRSLPITGYKNPEAGYSLSPDKFYKRGSPCLVLHMISSTTSAPCIIPVPVNDLILIGLGAMPFPRSKRSIQAALWLLCGSADWIPYITQLRADA